MGSTTFFSRYWRCFPFDSLKSSTYNPMPYIDAMATWLLFQGFINPLSSRHRIYCAETWNIKTLMSRFLSSHWQCLSKMAAEGFTFLHRLVFWTKKLIWITWAWKAITHQCSCLWIGPDALKKVKDMSYVPYQLISRCQHNDKCVYTQVTPLPSPWVGEL